MARDFEERGELLVVESAGLEDPECPVPELGGDRWCSRWARASVREVHPRVVIDRPFLMSVFIVARFPGFRRGEGGCPADGAPTFRRAEAVSRMRAVIKQSFTSVLSVAAIAALALAGCSSKTANDAEQSAAAAARSAVVTANAAQSSSSPSPRPPESINGGQVMLPIKRNLLFMVKADAEKWTAVRRSLDHRNSS